MLESGDDRIDEVFLSSSSQVLTIGLVRKIIRDSVFSLNFVTTLACPFLVYQSHTHRHTQESELILIVWKDREMER